jgi:hypothetical protein
MSITYNPGNLFWLLPWGSIIFFPHHVAAQEYRLNFSVTQQQLHNDNYLLSNNHEQSLMGSLLIPMVNVERVNERSRFKLGARTQIERYDRTEFNEEHPDYWVDYKREYERLSWSVNYRLTEQSTRISELQDSGNIATVPSTATESTVGSAVNYKLSERDNIALNGNAQRKRYQSELYADLDNYALQPVYSRDISEQINIYAGASFTRYESRYTGNFPFIPVAVNGLWLCPPGTVFFVGQCLGTSMTKGDAVNLSESRGGTLGFNWQTSQTLRWSGKWGSAYTETQQTIALPKVSAVFGAPIDKEILFGGARRSTTDAASSIMELTLAYARERSEWKWGWMKQIQPSSTGSLWDVNNYQFDYLYKLDEQSRVMFSLLRNSYETLDERILDNSNGDRNLSVASLSYARQLSAYISVNLNIQFTQQEVQQQSTINAKALQGFISLTYSPRAWIW